MCVCVCTISNAVLLTFSKLLDKEQCEMSWEGGPWGTLQKLAWGGKTLNSFKQESDFVCFVIYRVNYSYIEVGCSRPGLERAMTPKVGWRRHTQEL